jgi:uncharacterized OB-fold protein
VALADALNATPVLARRRVDFDDGRLVGSRCAECAAVSWPTRAICYRCGSARMIETSFARSGDLVTYTTVWVSRPGLEAPYTLGQVIVDDGPLVFAHIRKLPPEQQVPLRVHILVAGSETAVPPFWFEPEEERE